MLKGVIICPDSALLMALEVVFEETPVLSVVRTMEHYPGELELTRMLRANAPEVLFLSLESLEQAATIYQQAVTQLPGIQVIAIGSQADPATLISLMRTGIREMLPFPFEKRLLLEALARAKEILDRHPVEFKVSNRVYAFLPAKPGVGTTTLAANCALALSRDKDQRALLLDCDLTGSMIRFLFQLDGGGSLADAAAKATELDDAVWTTLVNPLRNLDVLQSGQFEPERYIEPARVRLILEFARRSYHTILLDLSGNMERFSLEVFKQSKEILLVVTPELPSLHLAREKLLYLRTHQLDQRVVVLLNRFNSRTMSSAQVKDVLKCPVLMTFPNDYPGVQRSMTGQGSLDEGSELSRQLAALANYLALDKQPAAPDAKGAGLLGFLRI